MPIGKQSLSRVASGGTETALTPEIPATESPKKTAAVKKTAEVKKTVIAKPSPAAGNCSNKVYAVGDKLPEYLL